MTYPADDLVDVHVRYSSTAARDAALQTGAKSGLTEGINRLERFLTE